VGRPDQALAVHGRARPRGARRILRPALHGAEYDRARAIIRKADEAWLDMLNARKGDEPKLADQAKATDAEGVKRVMRNLDRSFKAAKGRTTK
jgi:plasmid stability protein